MNHLTKLLDQLVHGHNIHIYVGISLILAARLKQLVDEKGFPHFEGTHLGKTGWIGQVTVDVRCRLPCLQDALIAFRCPGFGCNKTNFAQA